MLYKHHKYGRRRFKISISQSDLDLDIHLSAGNEAINAHTHTQSHTWGDISITFEV